VPPLARFKAIVFDLGGVLLRLRDPIENFGLHMTETQFLELWLKAHSVREFERGAIDPKTFAEMAVAELNLPMDPNAFLARFDAWPEELFPGTLSLLDALPSSADRVLLSNTNAAHWGRSTVSGALAGHLDREFLSFRTGLLKPDHAAFQQVSRACRCAPEEMLFFDDNPLNVAAASQFGIQAFVTKGPAEVRKALESL
jgi:putative hydrolase of the HAD superfamily